jgi:GalNAc5-diNAcBac-PP-undecaprenol beta-1,3-glucosyltransferase
MDLTIIVPTYNRLNSLTNTLESIKSLKYDIEIIIVDNGSSDGTYTFLLDYSKNHNDVKVLRIPINTGSPAGPYNIGLTIATGEYCCFMYDDDSFIEGSIDFFMDVIYKQRLPMYYFNCSINGLNKGSTLGLSNLDLVTFDRVLAEEIKGESHIVIKSSIIRKYSFPEHMLYSEGFVWFEILKEYTPIFHDIKVRNYNRNADNISNVEKMFFQNIHEVIRQQITLLDRYSSDLKRLKLYKRRLLRLLFLAQFTTESNEQINMYLEKSIYFRFINLCFKLLGRKFLFNLYMMKLRLYPNI